MSFIPFKDTETTWRFTDVLLLSVDECVILLEPVLTPSSGDSNSNLKYLNLVKAGTGSSNWRWFFPLFNLIRLIVETFTDEKLLSVVFAIEEPFTTNCTSSLDANSILTSTQWVPVLKLILS